MFGRAVTAAGTGPGVGGWVSGILNTPTHPWEPPDLCKVGGSPISWGCRSRAFTVPCHPGGRYSGLWVVLLVSPRGWVRVRRRRVHPVCHVPPVAGAVEAFFAGRDLASGTCRTYRQALGPLVEAVGSDRPVTDLCPDQVAAVFEELWADRAPATWNTRRGRHPGVRFVVWGPVAPGRRSAGRGWSPAAGGPITPGRSRWEISRACGAAGRCRFGRNRCGGCCMRPPPERRRCWLWMWGTWTGPGGGPVSAPRGQHGHGCVGGAHRPPLG